MVTIETIVNELNSVPEPFLAEVLKFIRSAKGKTISGSNQIEELETGQQVDRDTRDRTITELLKSFQTDEVSLETIDAEAEVVRAELYAKQQAL
ncbi:MAG: hypothetical protein ACRC8A_15855 [Microcoleaceae cyanobacterium]